DLPRPVGLLGRVLGRRGWLGPGLRGGGAGHRQGRRRGVRRPHQAPGDRAAAPDHRAGDVLRGPGRPTARPGGRHGRRRHAQRRVRLRPELRLRPRHRRADAPHPSPGAAAPRGLPGLGPRLRAHAGRGQHRRPGPLGQPALGRAVGGGQRLLRARLHDGAEAAHHPEHRLGRPGRLLPSPHRLDRRHRRARVDPRGALPRRLLLDPAPHLGARAALPRGLRQRLGPDAAGRGARPRGRPPDRPLQLGHGRHLAGPLAGRGHRPGLSRRGRRAGRGVPPRGAPDVGPGQDLGEPVGDRPDAALPQLQPLPVTALRRRRARPPAHPL
ncbi:MAG: Heme O synthase, protoheme IX farnesyltransferase COX10-CtaB, partial [uncultured Nocardioides sp.]